MIAQVKHAVRAPHRWVTRAAQWWLGPPLMPKRRRCANCNTKTEAWRTYADGHMLCLPCAVKREMH